ncbi:hypothetical protein BTA51_22220 [Hahella sp. CCB-MM4]|uniref:hypothetical protein n=1 Tax=Hahella sp. (strain CCB-MM4) TaxID=1926491 RepID=UPI000B9A4131|nr:hypothetical protein [Hahella sp. CCB-MM4]OZG71099.1 hypothetical protein BTA51_22220 [Hahella sp. CCB-MM4]
MFILEAQRHADVVGSFKKYREYLEANREQFPHNAFSLANSSWYFDFSHHQCPHDSWLENISIFENASGARSEVRQTAIRLRLLAAYHDGFIELSYPCVFSYKLESHGDGNGHSDWLYDEIRLSENGHVLHEIEWAGMSHTSHWLIESNDIEFSWIPHVRK